LHRQTKPVQQLRAKFTFFGVATAHQDKAGRVAHAQALAFHQVFARCGHIDQQIYQMVIKQVDFVDVQKATVRLGQQAGGKLLDALGQGFFEVERTDHAVFGGPQRQVHHRHRLAFHHGFDLGVSGLAHRASAGRLVGIAAIRATLDHFDGGQ